MFVEIQPDILETSSNLKISCYTSSSKTQPLQCTFGWSRSKNSFSEAMSHSDSSYSCSPYDLGYSISVDIRSKAQSKKVSLGVVRMDSLLRIDVANIARDGTANFIVKVRSKDRQAKEFVVTLKENCVEITDVIDQQVIETKYGQQPFQVSGRQTLSLTDDWRSLLKRSQGEIVFVNRTIRDLFIFSYRALGVKSYVGSAHILHVVHNLELEKSPNFEYLMEIQQLRYNLSRFKKINKQFSKQKEKLVSELNMSKQKCDLLEDQNRQLRQQTNLVKQPKDKPASLKDSRLEISGIINNLSISMGNLEELDRLGAYTSTLLSEIASLKGQLKQHQTKQSQMQNVIEYLKEYRDKVRDETTLPQGDRNHLVVKYKARVQQLRVENEYLFKQKEELSKNLKISEVNQNVLQLKYKRTIEIIDQYSQRLDSMDSQMAGYKQQVGRLTGVHKVTIKQQAPSSLCKEKLKLECGTLHHQYQHSKVSYGKLDRSRDMLNTSNRLEQSIPDIRLLQTQEAAVFKWKTQIQSQ